MRPHVSGTSSLNAPVSKPTTGVPQASASITELGHAGLRSAEKSRWADAIHFRNALLRHGARKDDWNAGASLHGRLVPLL